MAWGLLSLALAATASADVGMRTVAYAVLAAAATVGWFNLTPVLYPPGSSA